MQKTFLSLIFGMVIGLITPVIAQANTMTSTNQTPQDYISCKALQDFGERYPHKFKDAFKTRFGNCQQIDATIINMQDWATQRQHNKQCDTNKRCQDEKNDIGYIIKEIQSQKDITALFEDKAPYTIAGLPSNRTKLRIELTDGELAYLKQLSEKQLSFHQLINTSSKEHTNNQYAHEQGKNSLLSNLKTIPMSLQIIFSLIILGLLAIIMYTITKTIKTTEITKVFSNKDDDNLSTHQSTNIYEHCCSLEQKIQALEEENKELKQKYIKQEQENAKQQQYTQSLESRITELEKLIHTFLQSNLTNFNQAAPQRRNVYDDGLAYNGHLEKTSKYSLESSPTTEATNSNMIQRYYASMPIESGFNRQDLTIEQGSDSLYQLEHNIHTGEIQFAFVKENVEQASNLAIKNYDQYLVPVCHISNYNNQAYNNAKIIKNIKPGKARMEGDFCVVVDKCTIELL